MLVLAIPLVSAGTLPGVYLAVLALVALTSFEAIAPLPLAAQLPGGQSARARRLLEIVDAQPEVSRPCPAPAVGCCTARQASAFT